MIGTIRQQSGVNTYYLDGVPVTKEMYDAYFPSKLFPVQLEDLPTENENPRGKAYTRDEIEAFVRAEDEADLTPEQQKRLPRGYPIKSVALAVHPTDAKKAEAVAAKKGVPTEYTQGGRPILRDAAHRRQFLKAFGMIDRNSYTGH